MYFLSLISSNRFGLSINFKVIWKDCSSVFQKTECQLIFWVIWEWNIHFSAERNINWWKPLGVNTRCQTPWRIYFLASFVICSSHYCYIRNIRLEVPYNDEISPNNFILPRAAGLIGLVFSQFFGWRWQFT